LLALCAAGESTLRIITNIPLLSEHRSKLTYVQKSITKNTHLCQALFNFLSTKWKCPFR
jgi:hypothetical protein